MGFKTLVSVVYPVSVAIYSLPVALLLPPQVIQVKPVTSAPVIVAVNAPAINIYSVPDTPKPLNRVIVVTPKGGVVAAPSASVARPPVVYPAQSELQLPKRVIRTKPAGGNSTSVINFSVPTGVIGTTITIPHTLGYKPQIVIAVATGRTEAVDTVGQMDYQKSVGVAIQPPSQPITQYSVGASSLNGAATSSANTGYRKTGLVCSVASTGAGNTGILAMLSATDHDITFSVIQQFTSAIKVQCMLFGGPDLSWISLNNYAAPLSTGAQQINDFNFKPDFLFFFGPHGGGSPSDAQSSNDSSMFFGACDKNLNQWVWTGHCNDANNSNNG